MFLSLRTVLRLLWASSLLILGLLSLSLMRMEIWFRLRSTIVRIALKDFIGILSLKFAQCVQLIIAEIVKMKKHVSPALMTSWSLPMKIDVSQESKTPIAQSNSDSNPLDSPNKVTLGSAINAKTATSSTPNRVDALHVP